MLDIPNSTDDDHDKDDDDDYDDDNDCDDDHIMATLNRHFYLMNKLIFPFWKYLPSVSLRPTLPRAGKNLQKTFKLGF